MTYLPSRNCGYPALAKRLSALLPWTGSGPTRHVAARIANGAAQQLLGIDVDLRTGSLVSADAIERAIDFAADEIQYPDGAPLGARLFHVASALVPTVPAYKAIGTPDLEGSAWSCMVDAVLNARIVWDCGGDGNFVVDELLQRAPTTGSMVVSPEESILRMLRYGAS